MSQIGAIVTILFVSTLAATNAAPDCMQVPTEKDPKECCDFPDLVEPAIIGKCLGLYGEQTMKQAALDGPKRGCCIAECAMNETNLYTDGMLKQGKLTATFLSKVNDAKWKEVVSMAIEYCFDDAMKRMDEIEAGKNVAPSFDGEKICNPINGMILKCVNMVMFQSCPYFNDANECTLLKEYSKACPIMG